MEITNSIINNILYFVIGWTIGFISNIFIKARFDHIKKLNLNEAVAITVIVIWAFSMIIDILSQDYETSPYVQALMGGIVGFFFKSGFKKK